MSQRMETLLRQAALSTFEELAFLAEDAPAAGDSDGTSGSVNAPPPLPLRASVRFSGPWEGRLDLSVDAALLPALAGNMLGALDEPSVDMQRDALGEICNVICGHVLPELSGTEHVFRLTAPELTIGERADDPALACTAAVGGLVEGSRWHVALWTVLTPPPIASRPRVEELT